MKSILLVLAVFAQLGMAEGPVLTTYFACKVKEPAGKGKTINVDVKFAVRALDMWKGKGELIQYPGSDPDNGLVFVSPIEYKIGTKPALTMMSNLNGQGGDLRIEGSHLRLFGDGDGYQFTDLVIFDAEDGDNSNLDGYVRDYGSTYGDSETFKQFIKCKRSERPL